MTYSLSNGTTTVVLNTTGNSTYGNPQIQNIKTIKESPTAEFPIPTNDANATIVIDLLGTKRTITLTGSVQGTVVQINSFVKDMESFVNSQQFLLSASGLTFSFDFPYTTTPGDLSYTVVMKSIDWEYDAGNPSQLNYTASLVQGNS